MKYLNRVVLACGLIAVLSLVLIPGCNPVPGGLQGELNTARAKWQKANIDDYSFRLRVGCFCPPEIVLPVIIKVENGIAISKGYTQEPKEVATPYFDRVETVDKLFGIIQDAIDTGADSLIVEYDAAYGYPKSIQIDPIKEAIDEEVAYFIELFTPVR
ncbi:hypothetical protein Dform_00394 [Dehalogenimonas formicexedens]|uniref:Lipoprotein n=1 Tax=Dehalogenimonas formicexedens TaxID=1839801 RepID=A0A1P8F5X6_9CHLR|nr:DUF6174 domain-containing protein [Dehalogenimonas formicexedens]APV43752.1 hypothetical protein Dform_00394 [Dehalogenimonas formicexedens]